MVEAIIYTDGSSGPGAPGTLGSGYHGYYFDTSLEFKKTTDLPPNAFISKYGYIGPDNSVDYMMEDKNKISVNPLGYIDGMWANVMHTLGFANEAEVLAIAYALKNGVNDLYPDLNKLTILSDSQVALLVFQNATRILDKYTIAIGNIDDYKNKIEEVYPKATDNIKNYLVFALDAILFAKSKNDKITLVYDKVKGHSGNIGNEKADRLASTARKNCYVFKDMNKCEYTDCSKLSNRYWKSNNDRHPFLRYKELFFLHNDLSKQPYFTIMNYTSAIPVGQRSAEPIYGLVKIDNDDSINSIRNINTSYEKAFQNKPILVYAMDLNEVFHPEHIVDINNFGKFIFTRNNKEQLSFLDKDLCVFPIRPSGLAKQVYDKTVNLSYILETCLKDTSEGKVENKKDKLIYQNITDLIFKKEVVKNKEKLTCIIPNGNKDISVKLNALDINFKLYHNVDIIDRNHLKALEKNTDVEIWLVLKQESDIVYTYFTVVNIPSLNTYGIWHNMFSSRIFLERKKNATS